MYIVSASVSEARPGPPFVMPCTMSKVFRLATIERPTTTAVSGRSMGHRMLRKSRRPVAPSIRAASSGSFGIDWRPIVKSRAFTPTPCQAVARIIMTVLSGASTSQRGVSPTPKAASAWSRAPSLDRMNDQITPTPIPESAYGMQEREPQPGASGEVPGEQGDAEADADGDEEGAERPTAAC